MRGTSNPISGGLSKFAVVAIFAVVLYSLAFASLFIPVEGIGYAVLNFALPVMLVSVLTTIVFASLGGRIAGLGRTVGIVCGVFLIAVPLVAILFAGNSTVPLSRAGYSVVHLND